MVAKRVEGVVEAEFLYEEGSGVVTFDTTRTSPEVFIGELVRMTGYGVTVRERP